PAVGDIDHVDNFARAAGNFAGDEDVVGWATDLRVGGVVMREAHDQGDGQHNVEDDQGPENSAFHGNSQGRRIRKSLLNPLAQSRCDFFASLNNPPAARTPRITKMNHVRPVEPSGKAIWPA